MYLLIDIKENKGYSSNCLQPLCRIIQRDARTVKKWLKAPAEAVKHGYYLAEGDHIKIERGFNK